MKYALTLLTALLLALLAALKISGARLRIVTQPSGKAVKVFIGTSAHPPVNADGFEHGAYRIATGADWLSSIGDETDFVPVAGEEITQQVG